MIDILVFVVLLILDLTLTLIVLYLYYFRSLNKVLSSLSTEQFNALEQALVNSGRDLPLEEN